MASPRSANEVNSLPEKCYFVKSVTKLSRGEITHAASGRAVENREDLFEM